LIYKTKFDLGGIVLSQPKGQSHQMHVLIIDDEINIRKTLSICIENEGYNVTGVGNARDAIEATERQVYDIVFLDMRLGLDNGLDLITTLLAASPWLKIVVITAYASIETAVEAIRLGASDYVPKPFKPDQIRLILQRMAELRSMEQRITNLEETINQFNPEIKFDSKSPAMQRAIEFARQVALTNAIVLLRGKSGTGKTILAHSIHRWSHRTNKPFSVVSCPTLTPELLESELFGHVKGAFTGAIRDNIGRIAACEGGTLFLDEIGDLPLSIQPKLLRFIQDREYERVGDHLTKKADVRLIIASNIDLEKAIADGRFREDLYYRLNVVQIEIPPLSERAEDIEQLATDMLVFFAAQNRKKILGFTPEAIQALNSYSWPGNLRELRNVIERAVIFCSGEKVGLEYFPDSMKKMKPSAKLGSLIPLSQVEEIHIRQVLAATKSIQEAADVLGIDQATLWRKRKTYGI
jgi:NtrC-family two-component system response regulator AlgB